MDGGVTVLDAEEGVQSQSETVWHQADKYNVPRICFINKMDKLGADFLATVADIRDRLGANPAIMAFPIGAEQSFKGVVLLLERKSFSLVRRRNRSHVYRTTDAGRNERSGRRIPPKLIEQISETDDVLLAQYLEGKEPTLPELHKALRAATIAYKLVPIYCGSSLRNKGVQPLLDAVVNYLPSPMDIPPAKGIIPQTGQTEERTPDPNGPFAGLAFKIQTDPHVGRLTYVRIYSGKLKAGSYLQNVTQREKERVGRVLLMHANDREQIDEAIAGEIVAIVGLSKTKTGDTLTDDNHQIILEGIEFTEPVISLAIEPKTKADQEKMGTALQRLAEEDPTFKVKSNHETGQTIIAGMGELHLEVLVDRMKREFKVEATTGKPQVAYKETVSKIAEGEGEIYPPNRRSGPIWALSIEDRAERQRRRLRVCQRS